MSHQRPGHMLAAVNKKSASARAVTENQAEARAAGSSRRFLLARQDREGVS